MAKQRHSQRKSSENQKTKQPIKRSDLVVVACAFIWICGFLFWFFRQPIESTQLTRAALAVLMLDDLLGLNGPANAESMRSGWEFLPQRLPVFGVAGVIMLGALCLGDLLFRCLRIRRTGDLCEGLILRAGTGMSALSLLILVAGLSGNLSFRLFAIFLAVAVLLTAVLQFRKPRKMNSAVPETTGWHHSRDSASESFRPEETNTGRTSPWLSWLVLLIVIPFSVYLLFGAVSPPTDFDVLEYHLQGPKEWFQQGKISYLRHNVYTSFPFLSEMLLLGGMVLSEDWWLGALAGQVVLACYQLLTAAAVFAMASRWIGRSAGWLALLIYLTTPWTLRISLIAYAEGAIAFYLTASILLAMLIRQRLVCADSGTGPLILLCGFLAGSGMASKYTGAVSVVLPTLCLLLLPTTRRAGQTVNGGSAQIPDRAGAHQQADSSAGQSSSSKHLTATLLLFSSGVLLAVGPWLARNFSDTGNPVYPLAWSVFGGSEWSEELNARWKPAHSANEHNPVRIVTQHFFDVAIGNTWTSGLLFALAVPAVFLLRRRTEIRWFFGLLIWGFFAWWALTHRIDRFWVPLIPLLCICGSGVWFLWDRAEWRMFLLTVIGAVTMWNIHFCTLSLVGYHSKLADLNEARQKMIRADLREMNETLPKSARVLMVGEAAVFETRFSNVYNTVFDDDILEEWTQHPEDIALEHRARRLRPVNEICDRFSREQITHVYVNWSEILRYRRPGSYTFNEYIQPRRFQQMVEIGILKPPRVMMVRSFRDLDEQGRQVVQSWDGVELLMDGTGNMAASQLFEVSCDPAGSSSAAPSGGSD
ncbi:MAG: ArnT family glycosyltransferase [Planctomyces sp.]